MEAVRKHVTKTHGKKVKHIYEGYHYKRTGMRVIKLQMIMRNTTKINQLSKVTTSMLEGKKQRFFEREEVSSHDVVPSLFDSGIVIPVTSTQPSGSRLDIKTPDSILESDDINVKKQPAECAHYQKVPIAHVLKQMSRSNSTIKQDSMITSEFRYLSNWKHGHKIVGKTPKLVYPFKDIEVSYDNINDKEIEMNLAFVIKNIVKISENLGKIAIIVFELMDAQLFKKLMKSMGIPVILYLPAIYPGATKRTISELVEQAKYHILITDHVGARGLEFKSLIVVLNPREKYLNPYLVEAFTRCISDLFLIVIKKAVLQNTLGKER